MTIQKQLRKNKLSPICYEIIHEKRIYICNLFLKAVKRNTSLYLWHIFYIP